MCRHAVLFFHLPDVQVGRSNQWSCCTRYTGAHFLEDQAGIVVAVGVSSDHVADGMEEEAGKLYEEET